jgi:formyltetrahydrofolate-dependent phosphoribosylglycinamide formyltransferase
MASGNGSNLQALIDAIDEGGLEARIVAVISDQSDAFALDRGRAAHIPTHLLMRQAGESRSDYDLRLAELVAANEPDLVILAGWMRLLSMNFLSRFPDRVINIHPALPTELPGVGAIERAWEEYLAGHRTYSGVMVHLVPDEGVDNGPVIASVTVPIPADTDLEGFRAQMHAVEHALLPAAIARYTPPTRSRT